MSELTFACPRCHEAAGLVRVSIRESVFRAPIETMHGIARSPRVSINGDKETEHEYGRRTLRVDCTFCGFSGQPFQFVTGEKS